MSKILETSFELREDCNIKLSTGKFAKLANGSCTVSCGDTLVLSTACLKKAEPNSNIDFFPLQVEYRERYSASGIIPGGYIKREGRPSDREILISRMADRSVRVLFPDNYYDEVQISSTLLSSDRINESDILSIIGTSLSLTISELPFDGPIGAVRVGLINGEFIINPTIKGMKDSELDLVYAGKVGKVIMIEGDSKEIKEDVLKNALEFANEHIKIQIDAQLELAKSIGKEKIILNTECKTFEEHKKKVISLCNDLKLEDACFINDKIERSKAINNILIQLKDKYVSNNEDDCIPELIRIYETYIKKIVRDAIINNKKRMDGRNLDQLRNISAEIEALPKRVHGAGLFSRGDTQSLATITLGSSKDVQEMDSIVSDTRMGKKKFYLHYNFPGYSVGEVKRNIGPGRREIGHGNLAERSISVVIPENYDYAIRCISEIMGSNGSTSMASVCSGSLALMDAGIPIKEHVAGISCGLVKELNDEELLLDITGEEDHYGDMDFKIAGTKNGITGFQLDLKIPGISIELLYKAMMYNKSGREKILDTMHKCISAPKHEISSYAPQFKSIKINPNKIGSLIGPGGKHIKSITEEIDVSIDIENSGKVKIFAIDGKSMQDAISRIKDFTSEAEVGQVYKGIIKFINKAGVVVEFLPGKEGFVHVSELTGKYIKDINSMYKEGDDITVKIIEVDNGKVRLSCRNIE